MSSTWGGGTSTDWNLPANWTNGQAPNQNATINTSTGNIANRVEVTFGDGLPFAGGPEKFGALGCRRRSAQAR